MKCHSSATGKGRKENRRRIKACHNWLRQKLDCKAEKQGSLIINKPQSLRDANEKLFALNFPHCMPETLVTANQLQIKTIKLLD